MNIFLSYAEEDRDVAAVIVDRLAEADHKVFNWMDAAQRGRRIRRQIEKGMKDAQAFIALLSPSYEKSYWCGQELDIAINIESDIVAQNPDATFINVVAKVDVPPAEAGVLGNYDWVYMRNQDEWEDGLSHLVARFEIADGVDLSEVPLSAALMPDEQADPPADSDGASVFRNRDEELHKVLSGLTNTAGPHFWYVVAPPQLGKSWFLKHVRDHPALSGSQPWAVSLVDLRELPPPERGDMAALLSRLFGFSAPPEERELRIAQEVIRGRRSFLCMLDNADLLSAESVSALRACLTRIYNYVQDRGIKDLRIGFIAASRLDADWRGVTPQRFSPLALSEFNRDVVLQALHDLSLEMSANITPTDIRRYAALVHRVTEGFPALLVHCLSWVRSEEWLELERLERQWQFDAFAGAYIQNELLAPDSLLPLDPDPDDGHMGALIQACRVVAPYRLFTVSHLRSNAENDSDFRAALSAAGWTLDDLWQAISRTALLRRPLDQAWKELHPGVRRLLYRYFYRSDEQRAQAHTEARKFVETWADGLAATDQIVGLVECLWHEAMALRLRDPAAMEQSLAASTRALSRGLKPSTSFTLAELRDSAAERMRNDSELEDAVGNGNGLLNQLAGIVRNPEAP